MYLIMKHYYKEDKTDSIKIQDKIVPEKKKSRRKSLNLVGEMILLRK